jgi:hypothetical protein
VTQPQLRPVPDGEPAAGPEAPAKPKVTIPADGKIDLGEGDWIRFQTDLTVGQFDDLMAAFKKMRAATFDDALEAAKRGAAVDAIQFGARDRKRRDELLKLADADAQSEVTPIWEFVKTAIVILTIDCSVKGTDGHEMTGHAREDLQRWTMAKLGKVVPYTFAVKELHESPGI